MDRGPGGAANQPQARQVVRAVRCLVSGRVQGVWFRAATRAQAEALGVNGRARNLPDGSVEVIAGGQPQAIAGLVQWLWQGPPLARVSAVEVHDMPVTDAQALGEGFHTA